MKKFFIVFVFMVFMFIFSACSKSEKDVTVTYVIDELSQVTVVKQNSSLNLDDVPKIQNLKYLGMYVDDKLTIEYSGESIDEDVTLYVKTDVEELGEIDGNIKKQILLDYYNKYISSDPIDIETLMKKVYIKHYYGNYNGAYIVMMGSSELGYYNLMTADLVDGIRIEYNNSNAIVVWYDGEFYNLNQAFDNHYITKTNIIAIANYQKHYFPFLYQ